MLFVKTANLQVQPCVTSWCVPGSAGRSTARLLAASAGRWERVSRRLEPAGSGSNSALKVLSKPLSVMGIAMGYCDCSRVSVDC